MATSSSFKKRRGKEPVEEEEETPYDKWTFNSAFHEVHYEWMRPKKVLAEISFVLLEIECQEIRENITKRRWDTLTTLITKININIVKEFYTNAARKDIKS